MLADLRNPWFVDLLDGLNSVLHDRGLRMLMADSRLDRRIGADLTAAFLQVQVDGPRRRQGRSTTRRPWPRRPGPAHRRRGHPGAGPALARRRRQRRRGRDPARGRAPPRPGAPTDRPPRRSRHRRRAARVGIPGRPGRARAHRTGQRDPGRRLGGERLPGRGPAARRGRPAQRRRCLQRRLRHRRDERGRRARPVGAGRRVSVVGYDDTHIARLRHIWLTSVDNREPGGRPPRRRAARRPARRAEPPGSLDLSQPRLHVRGTTAPPR